jgi:hypothetical protein
MKLKPYLTKESPRLEKRARESLDELSLTPVIERTKEALY